MPVYNSALYLREAVDSILRQSLGDFELILINDGSTDESPQIIASYDDPRIVVLHHPKNVGLIVSLNEGLELARGQYIARMDADDISVSTRFAKQVEFLENYPEVGILGTRAIQFGAAHGPMRPPINHDDIRCQLLFQSGFVHSSVMMRTAMMRAKNLLYGDFRHAEDLELWQRCAEEFKLANLPDRLVQYRVHPQSITGNPANAEIVRQTIGRIDRKSLARVGVEATQADLDLHYEMRRGCNLTVSQVEGWLTKLREANTESGFYPVKPFDECLARRWFHACHMAKGWGAAKWPRMRSSDLSKPLKVSPSEALRFVVRVR